MSATGGGKSITYQYDANGLRYKKIVNGVEHTYYYMGDKLVRMTIGDTTTMDFFYDQYGRPFAVKHNTRMLYYVLNEQGDVTGLIHGNGDGYATYHYDAWGNITYATDNQFTRDNPLRYRGYVYDEETQLYYCQSRYYDPATGRFINADAYASTGQGILGNNMFAYCNNNPVNFIDPMGHEPITISIGLVAAAAIVVGGIGLIDLVSQNNNGNNSNKSSTQNNHYKKKGANLPSWKKLKLNLDHITSGHMPNGSRNPDDKKTVFWGLTTNQVIQAIHEAYNYSTKTKTQFDRIRLLGYSNTFEISIEMWVNVVDFVIETAYPKG